MARDRNDLLKWGDIFDAMMEYHAEQVMSKYLTIEDCKLAKSVAEGALYALEYVEAIEAEPVKHGRWVIITDEFDCEMMECSCCGAEFYNGDNDTVDCLHNYCPNCGADMRERRDGE